MTPETRIVEPERKTIARQRFGKHVSNDNSQATNIFHGYAQATNSFNGYALEYKSGSADHVGHRWKKRHSSPVRKGAIRRESLIVSCYN
jgi:hypothetical protein